MSTRNRKHRWCIFIDILGFSDLWESEEFKALYSLQELMRAIFRVGTIVYPDECERLFVHHMGDGFAIVSEFGEPSFERPIAIASALMRCVASSGTFAAAAIAEGAFADVTGCYPEEVRRARNDDGAVKLGAGLMTLSSVMGTAFIRAYRLNGEAPSGPFLVLLESHRDRIPDGFPVRCAVSRKGASLLSVDWVRSKSPILSDIQERASLNSPTHSEIVQYIKDYCRDDLRIGGKWRENLSNLLQIDV